MSWSSPCRPGPNDRRPDRERRKRPLKALRKKWKSSRGASILIALLFLLVSMMVGASVLMAAASNAGKLRSNREEQQRYLTLSSALTLICGELESVEYAGRYGYTKTPVYITEIGENGEAVQVLDHYNHSYKQAEGALREGSAEWGLNRVLPLYNDLDITFADDFQLPPGQKSPLDSYDYAPLNRSLIQPRSPHTLELAASGDADTYGGLADEVTVVAVLNAKGELTLTASLTAHPEYVMEAVLKPNGKLEQLLVPGSHTGNGTYETAPVKWTLDRIVKKEAADEETP